MASSVNSQDFDQDSVDVGGGWISAGSEQPTQSSLPAAYPEQPAQRGLWASAGRRAGTEQPGGTVEISLDQELLNTLYRRSRRRLRDIQASCQALLKLDRARSSLSVSGSEEAIQSVRRHLENLSGPCKPLAPAAWAELMRTRTLRYSSRAAIAHIQNQSGCRVHLERGKQEARLFGPKEGIAVANRLLDEFAETCGEEVVSVGSPTSALSSVKLQAIAHAFGITLRVEDQDVVVLGIKASVADASRELHRYVSDPEGYSVESLPKAPETDSEEHAAEEAWLAGAKDGSSGAGVLAPARTGVVTKPQPPAAQPTAPRASSKRGAPAVQSCHEQACPSCGAGRFCPGCGTQVWQVNVLNFVQPAQGMGMPMQPGGEMLAHAMGGTMAGATMPPGQPESFERESQVLFSWGPMQHSQMMFCTDARAASTGLVPVQFPAMQQASPSGAVGGATQPGQMGMMQAYMVPAGITPAWCEL